MIMYSLRKKLSEIGISMKDVTKKRRLLVEIDEKKHKQLKVLAAMHDRSLTNAIAEGVDLMIEKLKNSEIKDEVD